MADDKEWLNGRAVGDDEARAERHELRKIIGILCIVGVLVGLFLGVGGCAQIPICPQAEAVPIHDEQGNLYAAFSSQNLDILRRSFEMQARGECRWEKKGGM